METDLPALRRGYGVTRLVGLRRDPATLHYYWDVSEADRRALWERVGFDWGAGALVLRLSDPSDPDRRELDLLLHDWWGGRYVEVAPGSLLDASLVFRTHGGETIEIVRGPRLSPEREGEGVERADFYEKKDGRWTESPPRWPLPDDAPPSGPSWGSPDGRPPGVRTGRLPLAMHDRPSPRGGVR